MDVRGGGGGGRGAASPPPPPPFRQKELVGQFLLKSRAIFLFMFCFTNILNIFFSFVTCSMHKNPHQNAGNAIKKTLFFKIFLESMPTDPPRGSRAFGASRANLCPPPPPQISKPVRLWSLLVLFTYVWFN